MRRERTPWLLDNVVMPFFAGVGFVIMWGYKLTLGWWLDPWDQKRKNRALLDDLQRDFYFLVSEAEAITLPAAVLPFNYASVEILWRNLVFIITRGRGEVNVSIARRHARNQRSELGPTIAALEGRLFSEKEVVRDLGDAAALLRPRLDLLNTAFSEQHFARTWKRI
jgi:hypothetical protein